jgi:hypothetical protein
MNLVRTHWQNLVIGVLAIAIVVGLVIQYKNVSNNKPEEVADASPPAAKATDTPQPAAKATDAAPSVSPKADYEAKVKKLKAELEEAKLQKLKDEILGLKEELRKTAQRPSTSSVPPMPSAGLDPKDVPVESASPPRPRATHKDVSVKPSESLWSLPRLPKSKASDVATENLAVEVSKFIGVAEPPLVSYENEEQAAAADNRAKWLVAVMCSDAPASRRVKAAQELSNHPSKGVAQALSFTIGGGRARSLDKFASVREAATISLGEVGDITFLPLLVQRSKDDPSPEVRKAAYDAAEKIKARASE